MIAMIIYENNSNVLICILDDDIIFVVDNEDNGMVDNGSIGVEVVVEADGDDKDDVILALLIIL